MLGLSSVMSAPETEFACRQYIGITLCISYITILKFTKTGRT